MDGRAVPLGARCMGRASASRRGLGRGFVEALAARPLLGAGPLAVRDGRQIDHAGVSRPSVSSRVSDRSKADTMASMSESVIAAFNQPSDNPRL